MISFLRSKQFISQRLFLLLFLSIYLFNFLDHLSKIDSFFLIDLRNRVIGARLFSQHQSPYYYKWDPSQPETLYDPIDKCGIKNNGITAPPSVLLLIEPIANKSYYSISYYWVIIHYLFFLLTFIPVYWYFKTDPSRLYISLAGIILLFSSQWRSSVFMGQSHFFFPAILSVAISFTSIKAVSRYFFIGLLLAVLVWIRPNAILLIPFLFYATNINRKHLLVGLVSGCVFFIGLTLLLNHGHYWLDFFRSCKDWVEYYVSDVPHRPCYVLDSIEGKIVRFPQIRPMQWQGEVVNVFDILFNKTGVKINQTPINIGCASVYLLVLYACYKKRFAATEDMILTGIVLYWLFEICGPIPKTSYYFVELFIVVYFMAGKFSVLSKSNKLVFLISLLCSFLDFIPVNLTLSEILLMISLCQYLLQKYLKHEKSPLDKGGCII